MVGWGLWVSRVAGCVHGGFMIDVTSRLPFGDRGTDIDTYGSLAMLV